MVSNLLHLIQVSTCHDRHSSPVAIFLRQRPGRRAIGLVHQLHSRTFNANQLLQIAWACQFRWPGKIVWLKGPNMYLSNQKLGFKVLKENKTSTHLTKKKMGFEQSHMAATDHNPELIDCSWSPQFAGSYGNLKSTSMQYQDHPGSTLSGPFLHFERLRKARFFLGSSSGCIIQSLDWTD